MKDLSIKPQLDQLISVQFELLINCDLLKNNLQYLTANHEKDISDILAGDKFFVVAGNCMWDILILELYKLFYKKEAYSLSKTLNIVQTNAQKLTWNQHGDLTKLELLRKEMEGEQIQGIIANLNHIRDKKIAHLDRNRFDKEILVHLDEVELLLENGRNILAEISIGINGWEPGLVHQNIGLCESTIKNLADYNKLRY